MSESNPDDRRIQDAIDHVRLFQDGRRSLRALVADVDFLVAGLSLPNEMVDRLREAWSKLEVLYSVSMVDGSPISEEAVASAARNLLHELEDVRASLGH